MTTAGDNRDVENPCAEDLTERNKNENLQIQLVPAGHEERKKRKRFQYRPYASPTNRIIKKCGKYNVLNLNIPEKKTRYLKDLGNTLLTIRWRWILLSLCAANFVAYFLFTVLWMFLVMWEESYISTPKLNPCIIGSNSFAGYFILVVETITTIGTGAIYPVDCHSGWVIITLQAITGVALEGILVTTVYIKIARPREKHGERMFSKRGVICQRDGVNCLIFRVEDVFGKYSAKTSIKVVLIHKRYTRKGESIPYYFHKLKLEEVGLLIWPQEVVHKITESSPFWNMSRFDLCQSRFEIMIVLEGESLTTGEPAQCQTSYTNKEILWGYCFSPCVEYDENAQKYIVNKKMFNDVVKQEMAEYNVDELQALLNEARVKAEIR